MKYIKLFEEFKINEMDNQTEISTLRIENFFADTLNDLDMIGFDYKVAKSELQSIIDTVKQKSTSSNNLIDIVDSTALDFESLLDQATYPRSGMVKSIKTETDLNNKKVEILNNFKKLIKPYVSYCIRFFYNK